MSRLSEFRQKEVINIADGKRLGFISDAIINDESGKIDCVIIPISGKTLGIFGKETEYLIEWDSIRKIGEDIVLVSDAKEGPRETI